VSGKLLPVLKDRIDQRLACELKTPRAGSPTAAVDAYAKTVYWAEVCYGPERDMKVQAKNRANDLAYEERTKGREALIEKLRALSKEHEAAQEKYERDTDHGRNQSAVPGGKDVEIDGTVPLQ